jgi:hypothetical protein
MDKQTRLDMLYELARTSSTLAVTSPHVRQYDLPDDVELLLSKAEALRNSAGFLAKDVAEKLLEARNGIALFRTVVCIETASGRKSAPFIVTTVDIHPSTTFFKDSTAASPMVFDIRGRFQTPYLPSQHGQPAYYSLNEEAGDKLVILAEHPTQA